MVLSPFSPLEPDFEPAREPARLSPDLGPTYEAHPDTGCEFAPSCLSCLLPKCRYDMPDGGKFLIRSVRWHIRSLGLSDPTSPETWAEALVLVERRRAEMLVRARRGAPPKEIAGAMGLSERFVRRNKTLPRIDVEGGFSRGVTPPNTGNGPDGPR